MRALEPTVTILLREKGFADEAEEGADPRAQTPSCDETKPLFPLLSKVLAVYLLG